MSFSSSRVSCVSLVVVVVDVVVEVEDFTTVVTLR